MKRYERRITADLQAIEEQVEWIADAVRTALLRAMEGLEKNDQEILYQVVLDDLPINRRVRSTDAMCHAFVARHLPAAGPLREVSSVLRLNIALERIGDYAVTMGRIGVKLSHGLSPDLLVDIRRMSDLAVDMLEKATRAFLTKDVELAQETKSCAARVDEVHQVIFQRLVAGDAPDGLYAVLAELDIVQQLERVSDQAKNICEEAVFVASGQTKPPKVYKVLFVDQDDALWSPLARALAAKAFPDSGRFSSAGLTPTAGLDPTLTTLADELSLDLGGVRTQKLDALRPSPAEYHVVVALGRDLVLPEIPFKTVLLRWESPSEEDASAAARELGAAIRDLMETLRGEDAS